MVLRSLSAKMAVPVFCGLLLAGAALGQEQAPKLSFEVASVRESPPQPMGQTNTHLNLDGALVRSSYLSLKDYIRIAYRVRDFQIDAPSWIENARFDITAKFPDGSAREQMPEMFQSLLAERFHLKLHREKREHAVIGLVVGKNGPKLQAAKPDEKPMRSASRGSVAHIATKAGTLADLAEQLSSPSDLPVMDMTGIEGKYDFDLTFATDSRDPGREPAADAPMSLAEALQKYGLKLERRKAQVEVLVIDNIDKTPTEN